MKPATFGAWTHAAVAGPAVFVMRLPSDMRNAVARAGIHGADGKHVPSGTSGAALADLIGDGDEIYICVDDH